MLFALLTIPLALPQAEPTLLPVAPEGWRFERLDFPLTFAPDIDLDGFEELRFLPGMFDAAAEDYFTYVFALQIANAPRIDGAFLNDFFERYYRGLCGAVAKGRFDIDVDAITAKIKLDGSHFSGTVHAYDAFVTGEAFDLNAEIHVMERPGKTILLSLVSPAQRDARVWDKLLDFKKSWQEAQPVSVSLNHLYIVPSLETYQALLRSPDLRKTFAVVEERTTVRKDMTYTGLYIYGEHTYFELLKPGLNERFKLGDSGIAFGLEREGDTHRISKQLEEAKVQGYAMPVTRDLDGEPHAWFKLLGIQAAHMQSRLSMFSLEYETDFLKSWHEELAPEQNDIARASVIERYSAALGQSVQRDKKLFRDVDRIHLTLDSKEKAHLETVAAAFGYVREVTLTGIAFTGPRFVLDIQDSSEPGRVTGFEIACRSRNEPSRLQFGDWQLELIENRAIFSEIRD
ncbi:MAG: hypothetical protein ACI835_003640 [Planctomycetota bacterium]|jgi:hypothetical protein